MKLLLQILLAQVLIAVCYASSCPNENSANGVDDNANGAATNKTEIIVYDDEKTHNIESIQVNEEGGRQVNHTGNFTAVGKGSVVKITNRQVNKPTTEK